MRPELVQLFVSRSSSSYSGIYLSAHTAIGREENSQVFGLLLYLHLCGLLWGL